MKILNRDEADQWEGSPNFYHDSPPYLLEPGDLGYIPTDFVPRPPNPHPRPPLVRPEPWEQPKPVGPVNTRFVHMLIHSHLYPPPMLPYLFITRTGTQNQVTTARQSRGPKDTAEVYAEVQARLVDTPPSIQNVIKTFLEVVLDWSAEGWTIEPVEDLLGFFLPCGGSFEDTDFHPTFGNMAQKPAANWGDAGRGRVAGRITYENQGHQGRIKPEIIRVTDNWTGQVDHYSAGKSVLIELGNKKARLEFDHTKGSKVEFRKPDGSVIAATDYSIASPSRINAQVPTGTAGTLSEVVLTMEINGSLRTGSYTTPLIA